MIRKSVFATTIKIKYLCSKPDLFQDFSPAEEIVQLEEIIQISDKLVKLQQVTVWLSRSTYVPTFINIYLLIFY